MQYSLSLLKPNQTKHNQAKLLSTATLNIKIQGEEFPIRAIIDAASDLIFISDKRRCKLYLPTLPITAGISGLNEIDSVHSNKLCDNKNKDFSLNIPAIFVKTLTRNFPT